MPPATLVTDQQALTRAVAYLAARPMLALDLETEGLDPHVHRTVLLAIGDDSAQFLIDCRKVSLEPLRPILEGPTPKVTHNGAFDAAMLRALGLRSENLLDTMLIEQVIENGRGHGPFSLAALSERYLGLRLDKSLRLSFGRVEGEFGPAQLEYACRDVLATFQVLLEQLPALERDGLEQAARIECGAVTAFADLQFDGIFLDRPSWGGLIDEAKRERDSVRAEIDPIFKKVVPTDLFGHVDLNYESEADLTQALSRLLGRPVREVNKQSLKRLSHPVGQLLLRYREAAKLVSTFGESFLDSIHHKTGRIHADFQQIGAATGRVACSRPNLQNIPRGSRFRGCFRAPPGRKLVTADYAGCELRILAELSGDEAFVQTFRRGGDLHAIVASEIFGTPVAKDRNPELRDRAKAINFGLAYGMGAGGLAMVTGLPVEEAERLLARYFQAYPRVKAYLERSAQQALERGYARTISGRRLFLQVGDASEGPELAALQRVAKNMPIQGTNADMLKVAMAGIRRRLRQENLDGFLVNCVHDEVLLEAAEEDAWEVADVVNSELVRAGARFVKKVPIVVDLAVGDVWQK